MPRSLVQSGLPGIGQDMFPDSARELGRLMGLVAEATILRYTPTAGAGASRPGWTPDSTPVRARLDPASGTGVAVRGGTINEATTHIITFENGQAITTQDRVSIEGHTWIVTALREQTDELIVRVEAARL